MAASGAGSEAASRHVRFTVVCSETRPGEEVKVVGAPEVLGAWALERSRIRLTTSPSEFPLWRSAWVALPETSGWEYKYVICGGRSSPRWESLPRRVLSANAVPAVATVSEVFDSREPPQICADKEAPLRSLAIGAPERAEAELVDCQGEILVRFITTCGRSKPGQELRVVGSIGALGNWSPHSPAAVPLQTSSTEFPTWCSKWLSLPLDQSSFEYKFVIVDSRGFMCWERVANRRLPCSSHIGREQNHARPQARFMTLTTKFDSEGTECRFEERDPRSEQQPQFPIHVPEPSKVVQDLRPEKKLTFPMHSPEPVPQVQEPKPVKKVVVRRKVMRSCASFGTLNLALDAERLDRPKIFRKDQRASTIGCSQDLPKGLVPTRRSLGLLDDDGVSELVREATVMMRVPSDDDSSKHTSSKEDLNDEALEDYEPTTVTTPPTTSDASRSTSLRQHELDQQSMSETPGTDKLSLDEGTGFCMCEPELEPEQATIFDDIYSTSSKVGEGAFGIVYRCSARGGGPECAVKVVKKDRLSSHVWESLLGNEASGKEGEISIHRSLPPHNNIVGVHDCFVDPCTVRIVMDMCRGGDLFDAILRAKQRNQARCKDAALSEESAAAAVQQVLSALAFCHNHGVVHRDVKAENILLAFPEDEVPLDTGRAVVKLCDFGLSARCWETDGAALRDPVGSPDYVAPEVARQEAYGQAVDVWSAGVLLFASLRGRLPFPARTDREALQLVKQGMISWDEGWPQLVSEAKTCAEHLLKVNPSDRPTAKEAQQHPFFCKTRPCPQR